VCGTHCKSLVSCLGFDAVLVGAAMACISKENGWGRFSLERDGTRVKRIKFDGIALLEAKRLVGPGSSLDSLSRACGLESVKGAFPFRRLVHYSFLLEPELPSDLASWESDLNPDKSPTADQVSAMLEFYRRSKYTCVGQFLDHYLALDCRLLLQSLLALKAHYLEILRLDLVEMGKFTVSSLSMAGAQAYLMRTRRPGAFFVNDSRTFRVRVGFSPVFANFIYLRCV
jgi:hypothetical protein